MERPAGIEPAWTALQTAALPLGHSRMEPSTGLEPALSVWKTDAQTSYTSTALENVLVRREGFDPPSPD